MNIWSGMDTCTLNKFYQQVFLVYDIYKFYIYVKCVILECGQTNERVTRDVLTTKLGVVDDEKTVRIPLLYYIVAAFQNINNADEQCQT